MEFTWKELIDLITETFETKRTPLAKYYLKIDKSTMSRNYSSHTFPQHLSDNDIWNCIFNLSTPKSLASEKVVGTVPKNTEKSLLFELKDKIKHTQWINSSKEMESDNYKKYVMGLIKLARDNSTKAPAKKVTTKEPLSKNLPSSTNNGTGISIPMQYKKCLFCEYFELAKTTHKHIANASGNCTLHKQITNSTESACDNFLANEGEITKEMLLTNPAIRKRFNL